MPWAKRGLQAFTYLAFAVTCANHQANLAICAAVTGAPSACAAGNGSGVAAEIHALDYRKQHAGAAGSSRRVVCGVIVRLAKYLVNQHYEELLVSLTTCAARLTFCAPTAECVESAAKWASMAELYGESVAPPKLDHCLNNGLGSWSQSLSVIALGAADAAPVFARGAVVAAPAPGSALEPESRRAARGAHVEVLRRRLLLVDEHRTLSRLFAFKDHMDCSLLLDFLGVASDVLTLNTVKPLQKYTKRLQSVLAILAEPYVPQYIRRAALALQLLDHAHRICAQLHGPGEPLLVRCQRAKWSGRLRLDAALDVGAATLMILVAVDVLLHFGQYKRYPYVCHQLCRSYSAHWRLHSQKFLAVPDGELDLGL